MKTPQTLQEFFLDLKAMKIKVDENPVDFTVNGETQEVNDNFIAYYNQLNGFIEDLVKHNVSFANPIQVGATLKEETPEGFVKLETESYDEFYARTYALYNELWNRSIELPGGEIVGGVISFPVADGSASYLVTKKEPLELQHIPVGDAYEVDSIMLKGLSADDVLENINYSKYRATFKPH